MVEPVAAPVEASAADTVERTSTMPQGNLPDRATLNKLLRYEPDTGKLYWRERTSDTFAGDGNYLASWNRRMADKEAFTRRDADGYCRAYLSNRHRQAHRVIWKMVHGDEPPMIDHINRNRADNRISNLRAADATVNSRNRIYDRRADAGIYPRGEGWMVIRYGGGKSRYGGIHGTLDGAWAARDAIDAKYGRISQEEAAANLLKCSP